MLNDVEAEVCMHADRILLAKSPIMIVGSKTEAIRPVKRTIFQRFGNVLCDSVWEPIVVADVPNEFTLNWALIQVYNKKID